MEQGAYAAWPPPFHEEAVRVRLFAAEGDQQSGLVDCPPGPLEEAERCFREQMAKSRIHSDNYANLGNLLDRPEGYFSD